jgi:hypothetical protein
MTDVRARRHRATDRSAKMTDLDIARPRPRPGD